jgi:hypothetical protein
MVSVHDAIERAPRTFYVQLAKARCTITISPNVARLARCRVNPQQPIHRPLTRVRRHIVGHFDAVIQTADGKRLALPCDLVQHAARQPRRTVFGLDPLQALCVIPTFV